MAIAKNKLSHFLVSLSTDCTVSKGRSAANNFSMQSMHVCTSLCDGTYGSFLFSALKLMQLDF